MFAPTWDLFILVFFAIIVAYSFIIGRNATLKIIIATYLSILTADGIGDMFQRFFLDAAAPIRLFSATGDGSLLILKIIIFVVGIVLVTIRGGFVVEIGQEHSALMQLATTAAFGFLSAGLIISTILVYISGGSFVGGIPDAGVKLAGLSYFAKMMTMNYSFWFAMPAISFLIASFVGEGEDPHAAHAAHGHDPHGHEE